MDRIVITIHPARSDEGLLSVSDAMQQVLDAMKLFQDAQAALGSPHESFDWKLERATANSPFTVVALAQPRDPSVDVSAAVARVKTDVLQGVRNLVSHRVTAPWMTPESLSVARGIFSRTLNGIGETNIDVQAGEVISIKRTDAESGIEAIASINVLALDQDLPARQSYGEIEGVMLAAGRWRNRPAIQIRTDLYGFVWCPLERRLIEQFGGETHLSEVWRGKNVAITGRLFYALGGKLSYIEALEIREVLETPAINLETILDPNFTAGMDPSEYLERLHEGQLA